jgi:hypothetical protein
MLRIIASLHNVMHKSITAQFYRVTLCIRAANINTGVVYWFDHYDMTVFLRDINTRVDHNHLTVFLRDNGLTIIT